MKILVTYQSKSGFTEKYAQWISQELSCEMKAAEEVTAQEATAYELVIHGGWLMAGSINGLEKIRKMNPKKLVVFGVGLAENGSMDEAVKKRNHLENTPFFYMQGGANPEKLGLFSKLVVRIATKKPLTFLDLSKQEYTDGLIQYVRQMDIPAGN